MMMTDPGRILLVGWRNLHSATGEWQLIANRAAAVYEATGIRTEAAVFVNMKKHRDKPQVTHPAGLQVQIVDATLNRIPIAYLETIQWLRARRERTRAVVFSGLPSYPLVRLVSKWGIPVFGDVHGAYEEMKEFGRHVKPVNYALVRICNLWEASATRQLTARLVVSRALAEHSRRMHGNVPCVVIPCGVKSVCENSLELRQIWRERHGWQGKTVWVYCGGLSVWQWVDRVIAQFSEYTPGGDNVLWLITPDTALCHEKCLAAGIPRERFRSETLLPDEIQERLPAGDIGFLLRDDNVTNHVAFPNKFAQYVNAGLLTVLTRGLSEPATLSMEYGASIVLDSPWTSLSMQPWQTILSEALARREGGMSAFHASCHTLVKDHLVYSRTARPLIDAL